jgi:hypothetical protein
MYIALAQEVIEDFLNAIKDELIAYLDTNDRNASGRSKNSLTVTADATSGQLTGAKWIEYTFRGRAPGKLPPISALIEWCASRGLPRSMAWAVAKIIAREGTKLYREGRNVLNEIITAEHIEKFKNSILATIKANLETEIKTLIAA